MAQSHGIKLEEAWFNCQKEFLKFPLKRAQIFEQHLSQSSSLSCHFTHSLQTPKGLLSISWRKVLQPLSVTSFSSSLPPPHLLFLSPLLCRFTWPLSQKRESIFFRRKEEENWTGNFKIYSGRLGNCSSSCTFRVNNFWFFYTGYSLNVNLLLPSFALLVHVLPTITGGCSHGFVSCSAHGLTGT